MAQCEWADSQRDRCWLDAEEGEPFCIFHLPVASRAKPDSKFWHAFANYYVAQTPRDPQVSAYVLGLWA
jgi:hypothetical protein